MLKVLSDPYTVLKFQNLCGLTKANPTKSGISELPPSSAGRCSSTPDRVSEQKDGIRSRKYDSKVDDDAYIQAGESKTAPDVTYNPYMHGLYFFGSSLGDEAFYTAFFPYVFWNVDEYLGRRLIILWVISMYVGQIMKDILRWPRPASPPVIVIERRYESEYGMPSTHATVATIIPFTLVYFTFGRFEYSFWPGVAFVVFWCCLVCSSRIYMGVHSPQDLIGGVALGILMLYVSVPYLDGRLELLLAEKYAVVPILLLTTLMIYIYPQSTVWTSSRRETTRVVGVGCGVLLGFWLRYAVEWMPITDPYEGVPYPYDLSTIAIVRCLTRIIFGVPILVLAKIVTTYVMIKFLTAVLPKSDLDPKQNSQIDIPTVFMCYTVVGFCAVYAAPKTFTALNLS